MYRFTRSLLAALVAAAILSACGGNTVMIPGAHANAQASSAPAAAGPPASLTALTTVNDDLEPVATGQVTGSAAATAIQSGIAAWPGAKALLSQSGALYSQLTDVDTALTAANSAIGTPNLQRAANEVTEKLSFLFESAGDNVPNEVHTMSYVDRSLVIDANAGDWARAAVDSSSIASQWSFVHDEAVSRPGSAAVVKSVEANLAAINSAVGASDATALLTAANKAQSDIDPLAALWAGP